MKDNTVTVDSSVTPSALRVAPKFNVSVPFIDRHLDEGRADKTAIRTASEDVTYRQLAERVNRCGNVVKALGIETGERVLMVVKDCPEFIYLFFGAIKAGAVPVPVNTLLRTSDYQFLIEDSECAALVYSAEFAETMEAALSGARHQPAHSLTVEGTGGLIDRMGREAADLAPAPTSVTDDCFWLYSSGSTGNPKGVVHGHLDMVCTSQRYAVGAAGLREDDTVFSVSKLFHSYGFGNAMTFPLWAGATIVLSDRRVSPDMAFEIIEAFRPTVFYGVPTLYAQQLRALETASPDLSSIRICISAGEALPADVFRRWQERTGTLILDGLGSTEALHIFISNTEADYKPGTSGRAVPGYDIKIVDEDGEPVAPGEIGTVHVRGESTAKYYWKNPEKTAATMLGDWLNTGDMYFQDEDGYFVNCGRGDDMLKVGALWVSPAEIETVLSEHAAVAECAVVGHYDDAGLLKPRAFVSLRDGFEPSDELLGELLKICAGKLDTHKRPRWLIFIETLPRTATGKLQRFKLREQ